MADVTEVIHKITYEVHDEALQNATKAIQLQLQELQKLSRQIDHYNTQLANLQGSQAGLLDGLAIKVQQAGKAIELQIARTEGLFTQLGKGILKGLGISSDVESLVSHALKPIRTELDKIDKHGSVSFSSLGKSLLSFNTALDIGVNILVALGKELFTVDGALNGLTASERTAIKLQERIVGLYTDSKVKLGLYNREVMNEETSLNRLKEIRNELQSAYPGLKGNLEGETNLRLKLADAIEKVTKATALNAKLDAAKQLLVDNEKKFMSTDLSFWEHLKVAIYESFVPGAGTVKLIEDRTKEYEQTKDALLKVIDTTKKKLSDTGLEQVFMNNNNKGNNNKTPTPTPNPDKTPPAEPKLNLPTATEQDAEAHAQQIASQIVDSLKNTLDTELQRLQVDELKAMIRLEEQYKKGVISYEEYEKLKTQVHKEAVNERLQKEEDSYGQIAVVRDADVKDTSDAEQKKLNAELERLQKLNEAKQKQDISASPDSKKKVTFKEQLDPFRKLSDEQRKHIKEEVQGYAELVKAAGEAYNKILEIKVNALDKEISVHEKKIEQAKRLAERGNTEVLRLEEERLRKAQQQREKFARQQQVVNAAITVSNAIAAVARAALEGGGFGSIATIAALISALAAGYAAVTSLTQDSGAYADGVVDYKGKGGPRDDKNWVRISSGESVITAEGTRKNRALLEAINKGAALHLADPSLPLMVPMFSNPSVTQAGSVAYGKDLKTLETKLDDVVQAIEDNRLKQKIFFDEQGVGMLTERAARRDRKKWQ